MRRKLFLFALLLAPFYVEAAIDPHGFWTMENPDSEHCFDEGVAKAIATFLKKEKAHSCVDLGAGIGKYVQYLRNNSIYCEGYDGNPYSAVHTNNLVQVADLANPLYLKKRFDWVISLEVGEHIPRQFETIFIENLHRHNKKGIILSWAVEGQGGYGHVNCRNNDYIKKVMASYGYTNDQKREEIIRSQATVSWLKNTIMVFRKRCE